MAEKLTNRVGIQKELREQLTELGAVGIPAGTPVNAIKSSATITEEMINSASNGDTVIFDGVTYTKAAALDADDKEWATGANLITLIGANDDWAAADSSGDVVITATKGGVVFNDLPIVMTSSVKTVDGAEAVKAEATITAVAIGELEEGDRVTFEGLTLTYVEADPDAGEGEFTTAVQLATLLDDLADWDVVEDTGAVTITAAAVGVEFNGYEAVITYQNIVTQGGEDGTFGVVGAVMVDNANIYMAPTGNTVNDAKWRKIAHSAI